MRILVFGDSIAYGGWDTAGGWVERIKSDAHTMTVAAKGQKKLQVINLGIGGDSSTKILRRMRNEIEARKSKNWPFIFIFSFGTNDERMAEYTSETDIQTFRENSEDIIQVAREYTEKIFFVGTPPLGATSVSFKDHTYDDKLVNEYDQELNAIVQEAGIEFIPIRKLFEERGNDTCISYDNVHPNDAGHEIIYNEVKKKLEAML